MFCSHSSWNVEQPQRQDGMGESLLSLYLLCLNRRIGYHYLKPILLLSIFSNCLIILLTFDGWSFLSQRYLHCLSYLYRDSRKDIWFLVGILLIIFFILNVFSFFFYLFDSQTVRNEMVHFRAISCICVMWDSLLPHPFRILMAGPESLHSNQLFHLIVTKVNAGPILS